MSSLTSVTPLFLTNTTATTPVTPRRPKSRTAKDAANRAARIALRRRHDDELLDRVVLGDVEAAVILRERYYGTLLELALVILRDDLQARHIVEAVLEDACSGWPPERGQVERWLKRLVRRRARIHRETFLGLDS